MKKFVLSVTNDLTTDQRVHKVALTLKSKGADVTLVGRLLPNSLPLTREYSTHRMRLLFKKGPLFYAEYNFRLFLYLLFTSGDVLISNDLDTLSANFLVSVIKRKKLVYDTHEYYTGVPELQFRPAVRKVWEKIEAFIFPHLKYIFTVNDSIANLYQLKYHKSLIVVRNVPFRSYSTINKSLEEYGLPVDKKIIIMQGAGINVNRGAEEAIQTMQYIDNAILLIIGGGDVVDKLKEMIITLKLQKRVIFKPRMPYSEMMEYTRMADIGLTLDKNTNINYQFSLPNKLFDYIQAQIPILCTELIEVAGIVRKYNLGRITENIDPQYMAEILKEMLNNENQYLDWKKNLAQAAEIFCWEKEEDQLMKIYDQLI